MLAASLPLGVPKPKQHVLQDCLCQTLECSIPGAQLRRVNIEGQDSIATDC